jgi:N,N'-diacetyllegionaminate synthase
MLPIDKPYLIGETAFHHEGDVSFIKGLILSGEKLAVNALKFHVTLDLDNYMVSNHEAIDVIRPWCFNALQWDDILATTKNCEIILLCNDVKSVEYAIACKFAVKAIELHATGLNDIFLLDSASKFDGTVILGTGGSTLDEIDYAIQYLRRNEQNDIFLMHGFQNYPTDFRDIKLDRMDKMKQLFGLPQGYADHTDPEEEANAIISCLAVAKGYNVLEKHFTTHFGEKRIDAQAAVNAETIREIKKLAEKIHLSLGSGSELELSAAEKKYGNTGPMKKAIVAREYIAEGTVLSLEHIAFKRTNESASLKQLQLQNLLGLKTKRTVAKNEILDFLNVEYSFVSQDISQFHNSK